MRRLPFLAALFGIGAAKAQGVVCAGCTLTHEEAPPPPVGGRPKPRNGECPVCGTMAEPFKPKMREIWKEIPGFGGRSLPTGEYEPVATSRRIDCAHCGVTFKQEAEK